MNLEQTTENRPAEGKKPFKKKPSQGKGHQGKKPFNKVQGEK
ncbi:MAG: hypothetical protein ACLRY5_00945 [Zhenhengia sp.]